ncbi:hypothetical protein [Rhodoblastus sp.]|uniref:hypothetical protein n=1 Tax=Rhodoblastus sp. TaxID=1962975 RepID=UPI003F9CF3EB
MSERPIRRGFAARPADPEHWIKSADASQRDGEAAGFNARLTIDVTPDLRGRIKIAAFKRGVTVAECLRELLAREFPSNPGDPS